MDNKVPTANEGDVLYDFDQQIFFMKFKDYEELQKILFEMRNVITRSFLKLQGYIEKHDRNNFTN